MEPWYNPQVEKQAIARVDRMGQENPVTVIRFIVEGTMEERIKIIQNRKEILAESLYAK
jgi:SNF2 family DNA or RNA helicase